MEFLVAGILAAGTAFILNRCLMKYLGIKAIYSIIPLVEEVIKTSAAIVFNASIFGTHGVFGAVEAVYDYATATQKKWSAAIISIVSHFIFGGITVLIYNSYGLVIAILTATMLHTSWNTLVVKLADKTRWRK